MRKAKNKLIKMPKLSHKEFKENLKTIASSWFLENGYKVDINNTHMLHKKEEWRHNIILKEVNEYIEEHSINLHKYFHNGLSSQALALNLIGPLKTRRDLSILIDVIYKDRKEKKPLIDDVKFEYEDRTVFNESKQHPTSIDITLFKDKTPKIFIECKLIEDGFGGCSQVPKRCKGDKNPISNFNLCYLHKKAQRKYWILMEEYGFLKELKTEKTCIFKEHYQFFREVLFSLKNNGLFVLLSDERNPIFHRNYKRTEIGLMETLLKYIPPKHKNKIISISIQDVVESIKKSGEHQSWIGKFENKYGL